MQMELNETHYILDVFQVFLFHQSLSESCLGFHAIKLYPLELYVWDAFGHHMDFDLTLSSSRSCILPISCYMIPSLYCFHFPLWLNNTFCGTVIADEFPDQSFQFIIVFECLRVENLICLLFLLSNLRLTVCIPVNRLFTCCTELLSFWTYLATWSIGVDMVVAKKFVLFISFKLCYSCSLFVIY